MEKEERNRTRLSEFLEKERASLFQYASYRLQRIEDVEDVMQNLSLTVLSAPDRFSGIPNLKAYLFRKLQNDCISLIRQQAKGPTVNIDDLQSLEIADLEPANFEEEFELINRLLKVLPSEQEEIIRLRLHGGLSFQEIAEVTEVPLSTAKSRFKYGIDHLRQSLKQYGLI